MRNAWFLLLSITVGSAFAEAPRPAEMAPRAAESLLTTITTAGERLIAAGSRGHILLSDDQGATWRQVPVPVNVLLTSAHFVDALTGWVVGHDATILHTRDGGETWALQQYQAGAAPLLAVYFNDARNGFAIGAFGQFLRSTDGGQTWTAEDNELVERGLHLNAVTRLGSGQLLLVGEEGTLALSDDAGMTWTLLESPYEASLFAVEPLGERGALIAGMRGNAFLSVDVSTGEWRAINTGSEQSVFGVARAEGGPFWLAGLNGSLLAVSASGERLNGAVPTPIAERLGGKALPPLREQEGSAFADVLALPGGLIITVGDAGIRRWRLPTS